MNQSNFYNNQDNDLFDPYNAFIRGNLFKNLYDANLIPKETVTMTLQESLEKYMSGNIAMIVAGFTGILPFYLRVSGGRYSPTRIDHL